MNLYQEHTPHILLSRYIDVYWTFKGFLENKIVSKVFPDGCVDIIISLGSTSRGDMKRFCPHIVGTMTGLLENQFEGDVSMLGIRFNPCGITAFTPVDINNFTNSRTDLSLVESILDRYFFDALIEKDTAGQIQYINDYFLKKLSSVLDVDNRITHAVDLIRKHKGQISVADLTTSVCLGQRQFERRFKYSTGLSPKLFCRITKFKNVLDYLKIRPESSLYSIALDCGYFDHAHLSKDYKVFTGETPKNISGPVS